MKKLLFLLSCTILIWACGGSDNSSKKKSGVTPAEETKSLPVSTITLNGKHANLFKVVGDTYEVKLVDTGDGWAVRTKITLANKTTYDKLRDKSKYERELDSITAEFISSSDVELGTLDVDDDALDMLLQGELDDEATITCKTWSFYQYSYTDAKTLFDKTAGIILSDIELMAADNNSSSLANPFDDEDVTETLNTVKEIVEVEGQLLKSIGSILK